MNLRKTVIGATSLLLACSSGFGQEYGPPDRGQPGDEMIQAYLAREASRIHATFLDEVKSLDDWHARRPRYKEEYFHMLGLWPMPEKTPLEATITGSLEGDGYQVDMIHFQSRPRLYVTGNLYRPTKIDVGERLPAVLYVCGHSYQGRPGNKTAFQSHGIWFARHGYVCLIIDSLQLGEIAALHHGTYRENRWWWHSRGYTPAGVECLNDMRAIDYLQGRPDVDPERIAVTGISGGGASSFWVAAADERIKAAVPVSGMADLPSYINNRVINGHCDCMFLYNTFRWPWTRIAALVAPRALLFTNSDHDPIFPMDANDRVINRLERVYSLYGRTDFVDAVVSMGGHAYRQDIRQAAFRFINTQLKNDPRVVEDSEVDLVTGRRSERTYPIPIDKLRVFPKDDDIPNDELNTTIDEHFVPMAQVEVPQESEFDGWKAKLLAELKRITFGYFPERIPPARLVDQVNAEVARMETEPGIVIRLKHEPIFKPANALKRVLLLVRSPESEEAVPQFVHQAHAPGDTLYVLEPRGVGATRWTRKNPPNYVKRSHVLLGRTVDTGRVWDVAAAARYLRDKHEGAEVTVLGDGAAGVVAACAALWEPEIAGVVLAGPPLTFMADQAPPLLNVLRVCDVPELVGMLAPRPVTIFAERSKPLDKAAAIYAAANSKDKLVVQSKEKP
jgi:dienelactone hydrolase